MNPEDKLNLILRGSFSATHDLDLGGGNHEGLHGHQWNLKITWTFKETLTASAKNNCKATLDKIIGEFDHRDLTRLISQPTAENISKLIFQKICAVKIQGVNLKQVEVEEETGYIAIYQEGM